MHVLQWIGYFAIAAGVGIASIEAFQDFLRGTGISSPPPRDAAGLPLPGPGAGDIVTLDPGSLSTVTSGFFSLPAALALGFIGVLLVWLGRKGAGTKAESAATSTRAGQAKPQPIDGQSMLRQALWSCRRAFIAVAIFSAIVNVLMLTSSVFMLEVYDRVLPSRSVPTLIGLCVVAAILFAALGLLDIVRNRLLTRISAALDEAISNRVFDAMVSLPLRAGKRGDGVQSLRDLDAVKSFLGGTGPTALFDLPWMPLYLAIIFAFHPLLGITALIGAIVLVLLTFLTEKMVRSPTREMATQTAARTNLAEAAVRNAEVLAGMGYAHRIRALWQENNSAAVSAQQRGSDVSGGLGAIARMLRMVLQSAVLAVGALLVIRQEASPGIIIAGSILAARALAPVDIAIANWRGFVAARQSWERLGKLMTLITPPEERMELQPPKTNFQLEQVVVVPPGQQKMLVRDVSFTLNRGQGLGVVGPSGSGKSCLARVLVGAWLPVAGTVRLDGATLDQWSPEGLGRHVGYLPQGVELFGGSIARNIARFDPDANPDAIVNAAKAADVHDLIVSFPAGYDTEIGDGGARLSAGQRQRIALARALYGDPFLVVLDEPDASLDQEGEIALQKAILSVRNRGGIAIVISHRPAALAALDQVLVMQGGRVAAFGPKEQILQKPARPSPASGVHILKSVT